MPELASPKSRITGTIDDNDRVTLTRNHQPRLVHAQDLGRADDALRFDHMILSLEPDASQKLALGRYIAATHDPASRQYHQWLSTQEFEQQFGISDQDISTITDWLTSHGFTVDEIPSGRRSIVFSGSVAQIRAAFHTEIHHYRTGGKDHLANASDPQIPEALSAVVNGVVSLHDFHSRPLHANVKPAPDYTSGSSHAMAPADFYTIYNLKPVAAQAINGTGRSIAILGRTSVLTTDLQQFQTSMGLPANLPQIIVNGSDPGRQSGDEGESDLDLEWAGAVAPGATIKFVTSKSTASTDGIDLSAQYAVSNNVADVISLSYGLCEADLGASATSFYDGLWQQATAQGITVFVSAGDSGAADCDSGSASSATRGKGVNGLCTSPYSTCVGGTQFNDTANPSLYWASSNNAADQGSALSYIPEVVWNESGTVSGGSGLWATGGGASTIFAKPAWQTGLGVPNDGKRDVPDVSLSAAGHDGYLVYSSDNSTSTRTLYTFGGTSASAPSFAGIMALINQNTGARQGNANPRFYQLSATQASGGPAYFHLITAGNNSVPGQTGYSASASTPYYNQATGLGSVDGNVLVTNWSATQANSSTAIMVNPASATFGQNVTLTATVTGSSPTGSVQFKDGTANLGSPVTLNGATASLSTNALSIGIHTITAVYSGDAANSSSVSAGVTLTVTKALTGLNLSSSNASTTLGQNVTFTATLSGSQLSGTIQFMDGGTSLGTVTIINTCTTSLTLSNLSIGVHSITAIYSGDANNQGSTSPVVTQTVNAAMTATNTALTASASTITIGQGVTLTATVTGSAPTGTVQFIDGGTSLGSAIIDAGVASFSTSALSVGTHSITASYSGDANNNASVSQAVGLTVTMDTGSADVPTLPQWAALLMALMLLAIIGRHTRASGFGAVKFAVLALVISASMLLPTPALAAVLAGWDMHSQTGGSNSFGPSPLAASLADSNLTIGSLTRGSGVATTGATGAARGWGGVGWISSTAAAAVSANDIVSFTITANPGYQVSIASISRFDYRHSSSGPANGVLQYQVGGGAFSDAATLSYTSTASNGASLSAIDLSGVSALQNVAAGATVIFRIVNYGGTSQTGSWYVFDTINSTASDLELSGTVTPTGPVNGACGSANGQLFATPPSTNLCASGAASALSGSGPWTWSCAGINGGGSDNCSANSSVVASCP